VHGAVEHLGGRELHLQDRDVVAVAGLAVCAGERVRQEPQSVAQQGVDLGIPFSQQQSAKSVGSYHLRPIISRG